MLENAQDIDVNRQYRSCSQEYAVDILEKRANQPKVPARGPPPGKPWGSGGRMARRWSPYVVEEDFNMLVTQSNLCADVSIVDSWTQSHKLSHSLATSD